MLEASLPRLNAAQSEMMRALERQAANAPGSAPGGAPRAGLGRPAPAAAAPADPPADPGADPLASLRELPRVVSLHHK